MMQQSIQANTYLTAFVHGAVAVLSKGRSALLARVAIVSSTVDSGAVAVRVSTGKLVCHKPRAGHMRDMRVIRGFPRQNAKT